MKLENKELQELIDIKDRLVTLIDTISTSPITRSPVRLEGSPKSCYLTGCKYNTGCLTNICKINAVTEDGKCGNKTSVN